MKFQETFEQAWARTPKDSLPKGDNNVPKILAFFWTMMAIVISEEGGKIVLDDTVYINSNSNIVSIPVQKSPDASADDDIDKEKAAPDKNSTSTGKGKDGKVKENAAKKDKSKKDVPPSYPNPPVDDKSIGENGNEGTATN
jgi:hypothetical protein